MYFAREPIGIPGRRLSPHNATGRSPSGVAPRLLRDSETLPQFIKASSADDIAVCIHLKDGHELFCQESIGAYKGRIFASTEDLADS